MRLVLDTSIIIASFRSRYGASRFMMDAFDDGRYDVLLSTPLLCEYEMVLKRPEQMNVHKFPIADIDDFLNNLVAKWILVTFHRRVRPKLRDPNDDHVLETAVNGIADAIVTHNISDFLPETLEFNIPVLAPGHIIKTRLKR